MERRMTGNCHVRCGAGENSEMISKNYLSLFGEIPQFEKLIATIRSREISASIILQANKAGHFSARLFLYLKIGKNPFANDNRGYRLIAKVIVCFYTKNFTPLL